MTARRGHGGAAFLDLVDRSGKLQVQAKRDVLGERILRRAHLPRPRRPDRRGRHGVQVAARRADACACDDWTLLAKSLRAPPEKFHGLEDIETRYRHRELDLLANEETRELFILRSKVVARDPALARRPRLPRGRDADPAAALRRRARAAVHDALQRARPRLLPAHRRRAVPQAPDRRRARARLRDRQGLPQRGALAQAQPRVHDARVVRGLRRLRGHRGPARGAGRVRGATEVGYDGADRLLAAWRRVTLRDAIKEKTGLDIARATTSCRGEGHAGRKRVDDLLSKHVEPDARRTRPSSSTTRRSCRRSPRTTARSRGWSSASSASRRAWSSPTRSPS